MANGQRVDPYGNFNYKVEIDGVIKGSFHEVSGLESSIDVIEHREGGWALSPRKLPGLTKHANLTLKRGITDDAYLWDWHTQCVDGDIVRKMVSVVLLDRQGNEKIRWNVSDAWPAKWTGPSFTAEGNDIAIETLEIAHEGLTRA
jgi:phage tail-like protein